MEPTGYPSAILAVVVTVGLFLLIVRPALLLAGAFLALYSADLEAFTYTRFDTLGPFLNLCDALVLLALLAALRLGPRKPQPQWVLTCLVIAFAAVQSLIIVGPQYEILRAVKAACVVPALWYAGWHVGIHEAIVNRLLRALPALSALQGIRQWLYVLGLASTSVNAEAWRTLQYLNATAIVVPLAILLCGGKNITRPERAIAVAALGITSTALVLTQTRSLWIGQLAGVTILAVSLGRRLFTGTSAAIGATIASAALAGWVLFAVSEETIDPQRLILEGRVTDFLSGTGREEAIGFEFYAWLQSPLVVGRGLAFQYGLPGADDVAWGHCGYVSYLSNLGLIGFALLGLWMPRSAAGTGLSTIRNHVAPRLLAAVSLALAANAVVVSALSVGLLIGHFHMPFAFLGGAAAASSHRTELRTATTRRSWSRR